MLFPVGKVFSFINNIYRNLLNSLIEGELKTTTTKADILLCLLEIAQKIGRS